MSGDAGTFELKGFRPFVARQSESGALRAVLDYLGVQGPDGGPLSEADFTKASRDGGFSGNVIVGTDLATVRLPSAGAPK